MGESPFKINDRPVSPEEWTQFVEAVRQVNPAVADEITQDSQITIDEMRRLLDRSQPSVFTPALFGDMKGLLRKHHFPDFALSPALASAIEATGIQNPRLASLAFAFIHETTVNVMRTIESLERSIQWVETYYQCTDDKEKLNGLQEIVTGLKQQRDALKGFLVACWDSPKNFYDVDGNVAVVREDVAHFIAYARKVEENLETAENAALAVVWEDMVRYDWHAGAVDHTAQVIDKILPFIQIPSLDDIQVAEIDDEGKLLRGEDGRPVMRPLLPDDVRAELKEELSKREAKGEGIRAARTLLRIASSIFKNGNADDDETGKRVFDKGIRLLHENEELVQEVVGRYYAEYMENVRNVPTFDRFAMNIADGSVVAVGVVGVAASGFTLSPVIVGVESAYWLARGGMDIAIRTSATGKFSVTFGDVATAAASTVPLAGGFVRTFRSGKIVLSCSEQLKEGLARYYNLHDTDGAPVD